MVQGSAVGRVKKDNATGVLKKCKKFFEHQIQMVRTSTIIANIQGSFDHSLNSNFCEFQKDSVVSGCTEAVQKCQKNAKSMFMLQREIRKWVSFIYR